jgi:GxxExxY protein
MTIARDHVHMDDHASPVAHAVIGSAIEVHRELGPGLLESAYCHCLAHELTRRGIPFLREYPLPVRYKDAVVDCGYRLDFLVADSLLLEIKSVDALSGIHQAQILTYLKLSGIEHGLLINFNARLVRDGIKSLLLTRTQNNSQWTSNR